MPTYRSITLSLVSQFDILTIPEYAPPATPNDPFSNAPTLINAKHSLVSVYIPTYPASQFWLSYSISPPHPPKALYYFKLYIDSNHIVSWGCGEEDGFKGKTMFGLFDSSVGGANVRQSMIERRVLCFAPEAGHHSNSRFGSDNLGEVMEIKVFRSKGRKRVQADLKEYQSSPGMPHIDKKGAQQTAKGGIKCVLLWHQAIGPGRLIGCSLVNAGFLPGRSPKRFYKYALLDPLDQPFATFRYYYRTWGLGVISPSPSIESSSIRSSGPLERPLSPKSSNNTLQSFVSVASFPSRETSPKAAIKVDVNSTIKHTTSIPAITPSLRCDSDTLTKAANISTLSPTSPADSLSDISPLKITIIPTFNIPRPPTPPPLNSPAKTPSLAQLPLSIPVTFSTQTLNTQASKESFQTLIRTRLPSPDANAFKLWEPNDDADSGEALAPTSSESFTSPTPSARMGRSGSGSLGLLREVVSSARNRNRRRAASEASRESGGSGEGRGSGESEELLLVGKAKFEMVGGGKGQGSEDGSAEGSSESGSGKKSKFFGRDKTPRELNFWEEI
ncbi:hypothetical protein P7C71_g4170, partial [Lecanoromycetidae sp. Uapishka_2]